MLRAVVALMMSLAGQAELSADEFLSKWRSHAKCAYSGFVCADFCFFGPFSGCCRVQLKSRPQARCRCRRLVLANSLRSPARVSHSSVPMVRWSRDTKWRCSVLTFFFPRTSGRSAFPSTVAQGLAYEIQVDSDPHKLPTSHTCIGLVRRARLCAACSASCSRRRSALLQGHITLPSVACKASLKQKLDWCLHAAHTFEYR